MARSSHEQFRTGRERQRRQGTVARVVACRLQCEEVSSPRWHRDVVHGRQGRRFEGAQVFFVNRGTRFSRNLEGLRNMRGERTESVSHRDRGSREILRQQKRSSPDEQITSAKNVSPEAIGYWMARSCARGFVLRVSQRNSG